MRIVLRVAVVLLAEPIIVSVSGRISPAEALQAFVQTVGPLPGITVQPGAVAPRASHSAVGNNLA